MMDARPVVVRAGDGEAGPPTSGMERRTLLDREGAWAGWVRTDAGVAGGWHHHGHHDSYIFVLAGSVTIEFGPGGRESVTAGAGDFVFNPAEIIHRETTSADGDAELFVVRIGDGPLLVNTDAPQPEP